MHLVCEIRLAGLDAPELGQPAIDRHGRHCDHGWEVKDALDREILDKNVRVELLGRRDRYDRPLGVVICAGEDIGAWLVRNGYAISSYGDKYKSLEREAKNSERGMWGYKMFWDPRKWRSSEGRRR